MRVFKSDLAQCVCTITIFQVLFTLTYNAMNIFTSFKKCIQVICMSQSLRKYYYSFWKNISAIYLCCIILSQEEYMILKANFSKKPAKKSLVYLAGKLNLNLNFATAQKMYNHWYKMTQVWKSFSNHDLANQSIEDSIKLFCVFDKYFAVLEIMQRW